LFLWTDGSLAAPFSIYRLWTSNQFGNRHPLITTYKEKIKMKRSLWSIIIVIVVASLMLTACEFNASTANIKSAILAKDEAGTQPTTSFEADETFYLLIDLANAPDDTTVKTMWYAVDVGSVAEPNTLIDEASLESGSAILTFNLAPSGLWAPGYPRQRRNAPGGDTARANS
jgi:hypothetical protein